MIKRLGRAEALARTAVLKDWKLSQGPDAITRVFVFRDFLEAFSFMTEAAMLAHDADHHPEWTNVFNRVEVRLTTHDVGGLSDRDFALAAGLDWIARRRLQA